MSAVNQFGEGEKSTPTNYLPAHRGSDTEAESEKAVLSNFQIFGIVVGGLVVLGLSIILIYVCFYRKRHKDEISAYRNMSDGGTSTSTWTTGRTNWSDEGRKAKTGTMALDDGTTLVASGGPVYGFENPPTNEKRKKPKKGDSDSDDEEGQKKKKKKKHKSKSRKKRG